MGAHQGTVTLNAGKPLTQAKTAMILLHGRGGSAEDILSLADEVHASEMAYLAPQAAGYTWYPNRFTAPIVSNEPFLTSALERVDGLVQDILTAGIAPEKIVLLGFSQGACLALEYAARHARRFGGVIALSGGLIGETLAPALYTGNFAETPVFLGCSDVDPHIPLGRVRESSTLLKTLGATVTERIYPGLGHTVNQDEISFINGLIAAL
jgi:predicted esterase